MSNINLETIINNYFYKKTETTTLLTNYSNTNHTHDYVTQTTTDTHITNINNWLNNILDTNGLTLQQSIDQIRLIKQNLRNQLTIENKYVTGTKFKEYYKLIDSTYDITNDYNTATTEHSSQISAINNTNITNELLNISALKKALKNTIEEEYSCDLTNVAFTKYHTYITSNPIVTLTTSTNSTPWGENVTLTATITTNATLTNPSISFYDYEDKLIETVTCTNKVATLTITTPAIVGSLNYSAKYKYNTTTTIEDNTIITTTKHNTSLTRNHTGTLYKTHLLKYTLTDTTRNTVIPNQQINVIYYGTYNAFYSYFKTDENGQISEKLTDIENGTCTDEAYYYETSLYNSSTLSTQTSTYKTNLSKKILGSKTQADKPYSWGRWTGSWSSLDDDTKDYLSCHLADESSSTTANKIPAVITGTFDLDLDSTDTVTQSYAIIRHYRDKYPRITSTCYGKTVHTPTTTSVRKLINLGVTNVNTLNNLTAKLSYTTNKGTTGYLYLQTFMVGCDYIPAQTFV